MPKKKQKVSDESKNVFCVVEQNKVLLTDRYRVVIFNKLIDKRIIIDRVEYTLVESEELKPSINAHHFRQFCQQKNEEEAAARKQRSEEVLRARQQKQEEYRQSWPNSTEKN